MEKLEWAIIFFSDKEKIFFRIDEIRFYEAIFWLETKATVTPLLLDSLITRSAFSVNSCQHLLSILCLR